MRFHNSFDISGYRGNLFKADPIHLGTSWDIAGVKAMSPESKEKGRTRRRAAV